MNTSSNLNKPEITKLVKEKYNIVGKKSIRFDLKKFSILNNGNLLKNLHVWQLPEMTHHVFLLLIKDSYKVLTGGEFGDSGETRDQEVRHNAILINVDEKFPDFIIRPKYLAEKLVNLFLNFDKKLKNRKKFNFKYILESDHNVKDLEHILNQEFTDELIKHNHFLIEVKNGEMLFKFEKEINLNDTIKLIEIAKIIDSKILNIA